MSSDLSIDQLLHNVKSCYEKQTAKSSDVEKSLRTQLGELLNHEEQANSVLRVEKEGHEATKHKLVSEQAAHGATKRKCAELERLLVEARDRNQNIKCEIDETRKMKETLVEIIRSSMTPREVARGVQAPLVVCTSVSVPTAVEESHCSDFTSCAAQALSVTKDSSLCTRVELKPLGHSLPRELISESRGCFIVSYVLTACIAGDNKRLGDEVAVWNIASNAEDMYNYMYPEKVEKGKSIWEERCGTIERVFQRHEFATRLKEDFNLGAMIATKVTYDNDSGPCADKKLTNSTKRPPTIQELLAKEPGTAFVIKTVCSDGDKNHCIALINTHDGDRIFADCSQEYFYEATSDSFRNLGFAGICEARQVTWGSVQSSSESPDQPSPQPLPTSATHPNTAVMYNFIGQRVQFVYENRHFNCEIVSTVNRAAGEVHFKNNSRRAFSCAKLSNIVPLRAINCITPLQNKVFRIHWAVPGDVNCKPKYKGPCKEDVQGWEKLMDIIDLTENYQKMLKACDVNETCWPPVGAKNGRNRLKRQRCV